MRRDLRVEKLVVAECAACMGASDAKSMNKSTSASKSGRARPRGLGEVARAVQRCQAGNTPAPPDPEGSPEVNSLHLAVVHHFRARMHFQMAQQYRETVWDSMKLPRKFFIKYRGLGPAHGRGDLPAFRALYLRAALASASRATSLADKSVECAFLRASVLWALCTNSEVPFVQEEKAFPRLSAIILLATWYSFLMHADTDSRRADTAKYAQATLDECERILEAELLPAELEASLLYGGGSENNGAVEAVRGRLETVRCLRLEARTLWSAVGDHPADRHNRRLESGQSTHDQELSVPEPEITTKELAAQLEMHGWSLWDSSWDGISIVGEFNGATDADSSRRGS